MEVDKLHMKLIQYDSYVAGNYYKLFLLEKTTTNFEISKKTILMALKTQFNETICGHFL